MLYRYVYSLFGKAFEQTAKNKNCYIETDYFDSTSKYEVKFVNYMYEQKSFCVTFSLFTVIRLKIEEKSKFLDALAALLA
jgi:hypothetical protein